MIKLIAANLVVWIGLIGCYALPNALDTEYENGIAISDKRITYISPADQVVIDLTSEEFKQANKHANQVLKRAYSEKQFAQANQTKVTN